MAAKEKDLNELHEQLTKVFTDILDCPAEEIPSATLNTIKGFLKDNSITCQEEDSSLETLKEHLKKKRATVTALPFVAEM